MVTIKKVKNLIKLEKNVSLNGYVKGEIWILIVKKLPVNFSYLSIVFSPKLFFFFLFSSE